MYKIAIFSDIHGNKEALDAILKDANKEMVNEIINLGDTIGIGPDPKGCLDILMGSYVRNIFGNHELYYLNGTIKEQGMSNEEKVHHWWIANNLSTVHEAFIRNTFDLSYTKEVKGMRFLFMHFPIDISINDYYKPKDYLSKNIEDLTTEYTFDYYFYGHKHEKDYKLHKGKHYIGIPAAGLGKKKTTTYAILKYDESSINVEFKDIPYNRGKFMKSFKATDIPDKKFIKKTFYK